MHEKLGTNQFCKTLLGRNLKWQKKMASRPRKADPPPPPPRLTGDPNHAGKSHAGVVKSPMGMGGGGSWVMREAGDQPCSFNPPHDPTVGLYLGPYGDPRGVGVSYELGTVYAHRTQLYGCQGRSHLNPEPSSSILISSLELSDAQVYAP